MKYIILAVSMIACTSVMADQRFETNNGFCHFVLNPNNAGNEAFFANCLNTIVQNNDGTGTGTTYIEAQFPIGYAPITESLTLTGDETGIPCNMVDSNGTQYTTTDWTSEYILKKRKRTRKSDESEHGRHDKKNADESEHGRHDKKNADESEHGWHDKKNADGSEHGWHDKKNADTVIFSLICRNAQQQ